MRELAFLNKGIKITVNDLNQKKEKIIVFKFDGGVLEFVDFLVELVKSTRGQKEFKSLILKGSLSQLKKFDDINKVIVDKLEIH